MNFYNDFDANACAWTGELVNQGMVPEGRVFCESILNLKPTDIDNYEQVHFFNGISGWAAAAELAGWSGRAGTWFASLPCQPFSSAGQRKGMADERHLWPVFAKLVREIRPVVIAGEQVAAAVGLGWLDGVFGELEALGYSCGAIILGAHSVAAPHQRQRLYWFAVRLDAAAG